jgi:Putative metallopeptidase
VHGAPLQRFYNLLCMGYGVDRDLFADLVEKEYLPAQRARGCRVEFGEINFAFGPCYCIVDRELAKAILARDWIPETIFRPPPPAPEE